MPQKKQSLTPLSQKQQEKLEMLARMAWAGVPEGTSELAKYSKQLKSSGVPSGLIEAVIGRTMRLQELREKTRKATERSKRLLRLTDPFGLVYTEKKRHMSRKKGRGY